MSKEEEESSLREQSPPNTMRDIAISVLFMVFAGGMLMLSEQFAGTRISEYDPGAAFWPRVILVVILVTGLINTWKLYQRAKKNDEIVTVSLSDFSGTTGLKKKQRQYVLAIAISVIFIFLLEYIGFLSASPFFLFAFAYIIGYRDIGKLAVFSIAVTLIVFVTFGYIMNIPLPNGGGIFREFSIYASNFF